MTGTVYLIGAGPGAPDLLTLRAAKLLAQSDVVFYDALVHPETLALALGAVHVPVGKRCGRHSTAQRFINKRLIDCARKHRVVVRLKGGDPMLFGRAQEEIDALSSASVPYEVVPGVTAALAASAELGISLTQRGVARSVVFVTPRVAEGHPASDWARTVATSDTAVIYMGAGEAAMISSTLLAQGMSPLTPVVVVANASLEERQALMMHLQDLAGVSRDALHGPALIMIGDIYADAVSNPVSFAPQQQSAWTTSSQTR